VEIAQYGIPESEGSFTSSGIQVVRFDPPFAPPYTITKIAFASATLNGVPAVFPSVRLCGADPATGAPLLSSPLLQITPYSGTAAGMNEVPVNITVSDSGSIFYWCVEFPSRFTTDFPTNYPYLQMDSDMERGYFDNSFQLTSFGTLGSLLPLRNLIVSMFCRPSSEERIPIEATSRLGGNRIGTGMELSFVPPRRRADGEELPGNSLVRVDVLRRSSPQAHWQVLTGTDGRWGRIFVDSLANALGASWTTQAMDRMGNRAITSSVLLVAPFFFSDAYPDEPNGTPAEATPLSLPMDPRDETLVPAGDRDFFRFVAAPGDTIVADAGGVGPGAHRPDLVITLSDSRGRIVASHDNSLGFGNGVRYRVPSRGRGSTQEFTLQISEKGGSFFAPEIAPREFFSPKYILFVRLIPEGFALAGHSLSAVDKAEQISFQAAGDLPTGEIRLAYVLPQAADGERVCLRIYDVQGRLARTLLDRTERAGSHIVAWDGLTDRGYRAGSGVYYARFRAGAFEAREKLVLMR